MAGGPDHKLRSGVDLLATWALTPPVGGQAPPTIRLALGIVSGERTQDLEGNVRFAGAADLPPQPPKLGGEELVILRRLQDRLPDWVHLHGDNLLQSPADPSAGAEGRPGDAPQQRGLRDRLEQSTLLGCVTPATLCARRRVGCRLEQVVSMEMDPVWQTILELAVDRQLLSSDLWRLWRDISGSRELDVPRGPEFALPLRSPVRGGSLAEPGHQPLGPAPEWPRDRYRVAVYHPGHPPLGTRCATVEVPKWVRPTVLVCSQLGVGM